MSYNPVKNVNFGALPNYAIANVPILSYALLGITAFTLGYITIKDKESEKESDKGGLMNTLKDTKDSIGNSIQEVGQEAKDIGNTIKDKAESVIEKGGRRKQKQKQKSKSKTKSKKTQKKKH
jgi:hypothetical protein